MPKKLRIDIAEVVFELSVPCTNTHTCLEHYFHEYTTSAQPHYFIIIDSFVPPDERSHADSPVAEVNTLPDGRIAIVSTGDNAHKLGSVNTHTNEVILNSHSCRSGYLLTAAIRVAMHYFIECNSGFFLHSACGTNGNRTVAFTGKSTAGKTTALGNLHPEKVITEDAAVVRFTDRFWTIFATPFRGEKPAKAKLNTLCFPRKWNGAPYLNLTSPAETVTELSCNGMFAAPSCDEHMNRVLDTMVLCGNTIPGFDCYFRKTTNLQKVFTDHGLLN